ncbi:hypothetical protein [Tychonema sp. LEGE 06208]|uniref:hypothetical protein n=1 Tax=Tychonema sp. LEGE 06208 TaxID=1828663 RepID=UPI001D15D942|nr:hypothetical protein [Tychonema sp. LEGE 06208]
MIPAIAGECDAGFDLRLLPGFAIFFSTEAQTLNLIVSPPPISNLLNRVFSLLLRVGNQIQHTSVSLNEVISALLIYGTISIPVALLMMLTVNSQQSTVNSQQSTVNLLFR